MEVIWEIFELDPSWVMYLDFWLEISRRTPTRKSRLAGGRKIEEKGTRGMRWRFPRKLSVSWSKIPNLRRFLGAKEFARR